MFRRLFVFSSLFYSCVQAKDLRGLHAPELALNSREGKSFLNLIPPMMGMGMNGFGGMHGMGMRPNPPMMGPRPPYHDGMFGNDYNSGGPWWGLLQQAGVHIMTLIMELFVASAVEQMVNPQVGFNHMDDYDYEGPMRPMMYRRSDDNPKN